MQSFFELSILNEQRKERSIQTQLIKRGLSECEDGMIIELVSQISSRIGSLESQASTGANCHVQIRIQLTKICPYLGPQLKTSLVLVLVLSLCTDMMCPGKKVNYVGTRPLAHKWVMMARIWAQHKILVGVGTS